VWLASLVPFADDPLIPAIEVDPNSVTPGAIGFVVTFAIAAAVVGLIFDMVRRVRRVRYRSEINEKLDAEANPLVGD